MRKTENRLVKGSGRPDESERSKVDQREREKQGDRAMAS